MKLVMLVVTLLSVLAQQAEIQERYELEYKATDGTKKKWKSEDIKYQGVATEIKEDTNVTDCKQKTLSFDQGGNFTNVQ